MSFQAPPQTNLAPPGTQGSMMPGFHPPPGLPPPPVPPAFSGFQIQPPAPMAMKDAPPPRFPNSGGTGQGHRPHFVKKHDYYEKRNYQQNYRPPSDKPTVTVFVGNITEHASDALIRQLLMKCGIVINWKRVQGADGKLQAFGFCEYVDPETGLRAIRLLHDLSFGEKNLVVKVDQKTKEMLEEYKKKKALANTNALNKELKDGEEELDEATKKQDEEVRKAINGLVGENGDVLSGKFKGPLSKWKQTHSGNEENLEGLGMDKDKKHLISKEIRSFRDTYKDSQKQQRDEKEGERGDRSNRDRERPPPPPPPERSVEKERERSKSQEKARDRSDDRSRSRSKEREREKDTRDTRDREKENRDNRDRGDRDNRDRGDRDRRDRDRDRRDRDGDRRDRDNRDNKGSSRSNRDRELDEDEQYEKRKRERRQKERSQAYAERLKAWETRERKKQREYDRELEKEREIDSEQSREKKHLLEFLEDYDDERDDPKYYKGSSFDRRLQARIQEMESDDKDRQREMEEIEEIRKRLGDSAVELEEEAMEEDPEPLPEPEPEPEPRPTLQATFKPAATVVELAPKVASPVPQYHSPKNVPAVVNQNHKAKVQEPQSEVDGSHGTQKKTFVFEMKSKGTVGSANSNRKKLDAVFNSEEDASNTDTPKRKLVPLDYSEEEQKAVATAKSAEQKKKSIKTLIERIPTAKNELFAYSLDWDCVDQNLIDRRIRPWVNKKIVEYIGEEEPSLVDFMCTKLLARSQPDNILHDVSMVLDDEAEVFVVKMWRLLIYETEAKKIGLVK